MCIRFWQGIGAWAGPVTRSSSPVGPTHSSARPWESSQVCRLNHLGICFLNIYGGVLSIFVTSLGMRYVLPLGSIHTSFPEIVTESTSFKMLRLSRIQQFY
jgi:hypothetical protein